MKNIGRNEVLKKAILEVWASVRQFCLENKFNASQVGRLINLEISPLTAKGEYRDLCKRLSDVLGLGLEDLFPLLLYGDELPADLRAFSYQELASADLISEIDLSHIDQPEVMTRVHLSLLKEIEPLNKERRQALIEKIRSERQQGESDSEELLCERFYRDIAFGCHKTQTEFNRSSARKNLVSMGKDSLAQIVNYIESKFNEIKGDENLLWAFTALILQIAKEMGPEYYASAPENLRNLEGYVKWAKAQ